MNFYRILPFVILAGLIFLAVLRHKEKKEFQLSLDRKQATIDSLQNLPIISHVDCDSFVITWKRNSIDINLDPTKATTDTMIGYFDPDSIKHLIEFQP